MYLLMCTYIIRFDYRKFYVIYLLDKIFKNKKTQSIFLELFTLIRAQIFNIQIFIYTNRASNIQYAIYAIYGETLEKLI